MLGEVWLRAAEVKADGVALNKALQALNTAVLRGGSTSRDLALYGRAQLRAGDRKGAVKSLSEAATKLPVAPRRSARRPARVRQRRATAARDALVRYTVLLPVPRHPRRRRQIGEWSFSARPGHGRHGSRAVDPERPDPRSSPTWLKRARRRAHGRRALGGGSGLRSFRRTPPQVAPAASASDADHARSCRPAPRCRGVPSASQSLTAQAEFGGRARPAAAGSRQCAAHEPRVEPTPSLVQRETVTVARPIPPEGP